MADKSFIDKWPRFTNFVSADWIQGHSYKRYRRLDMTKPLPDRFRVGEAIQFAVLTPSTSQILFKCDNCFRKHQPTNINCSMTMKRPTSFLDSSDDLYDFATQKRVPGRWSAENIETLGQSRITIETWKRVE